MNLKINLCALTLALCLCAIVAGDDAKIEHTTPSPLMDMVETKTEKPPVAKMPEMSDMKEEQEKTETPVRTVGDFIIHPLVAFRPRPAVAKENEEEAPAGKQAEGSSSTTAAPWPIIGMGLGSSALNLASQVSGWINDRIQLPGLVDTPVRDSSTTSTTTTPRPDVIVRVQHRPSISFNENRRKRPINNQDSEEQDYEQDEVDLEEEDEFDNEYYGGDDEEDDYEEVQQVVRPINQRRPVRKNQRRPIKVRTQHIRRPINNANRRRPIQNNNNNIRFDDYAEDDSDDEYYYQPTQFSDKRSQQNNFLQMGPQSLLSQIRLLARGQTPGQIGNALRQTDPERQQATFLVRRNGETVYLAPELLGEKDNHPHYQFVGQSAAKETALQFPQPPLTQPLKVNGQIQQYITIPYNQLGIVPPEGAVSVGEGLQSQPLIFSIPQSTLKKLQSKDKTEGPVLTANAVPLLTEASLADIFKPPQIPPSRTVTTASVQTAKPITAHYTPVMVLTQNGGNKIRGGTIVEKSPPSLNYKQVKTEEAYIVVNDDNEESERKVKPAAGQARFYKLPKGGRFAVRNGRELDQSHSPAKEELIPVAIKTDEPESEKMEIMSAVPEVAPAVEIEAQKDTEMVAEKPASSEPQA